MTGSKAARPTELMAKLGFLGLGIMGYPMARNLLRAGHEVSLWSNTASKAKQLAAEAGGFVFETPAQVAERSDCVFLCVGNTAMSERVLLGEHGVADGAKQGVIVADASTIAPAASRETGKRLASKGIHFLYAPCTCSKPAAQNPTLTFT